jgi:hypothetical protein
MVDIFVIIVVTFGVCSFGLCVCSQTCKILQTLTSSWLAQLLKKFQDLDPLKLAFHEHSSTLEPSKTPKLVGLKVQKISCESHGLLLPLLKDDFVA